MLCFHCHKTLQKGQPIRQGLHESCFKTWFGLKSPLDFEDLVAQNITSDEEEDFKQQNLEIVSSFYQGKFRKYSATLNNQKYILKVQQEGYPDLPATEFLCNQIGELLGLKIPAFHLIRFENQPVTFVTRDFLQDYVPAKLDHIYHFFKKGQLFTCQNLLDIIAKETGRLRDLEQFVEICLFDTLIGNHDRHGRNLGLIRTKNHIFLAPAYDNPSYLGIEMESLLGARHNPRGKIFTQHTKEPSAKDYAKEFIRLNFKKTVMDFHSRIHIPEILDKVDRSFISKKRKAAFQRLLNTRYLELDHELAG